MSEHSSLKGFSFQLSYKWHQWWEIYALVLRTPRWKTNCFLWDSQAFYLPKQSENYFCQEIISKTANAFHLIYKINVFKSEIVDEKIAAGQQVRSNTSKLLLITPNFSSLSYFPNVLIWLTQNFLIRQNFCVSTRARTSGLRMRIVSSNFLATLTLVFRPQSILLRKKLRD